MKVLLVSGNTHTQPFPVYPIGLDYVAGAISDHHQVRIVDINTQEDGEPLARAIEGFVPEVIGLSIRNVDTSDATNPDSFFANCRDLVASIRAQTTAPLVLGGSGFTIFPETMMRGLGADYGIIGEGERLSLLLDALERREDAPAGAGIATPHGPATVPPPWAREIVRRFDPSLPHVAFYLKRGGMLNLQTKRGCRFNCIYCTYPNIEGRIQRLVDGQTDDGALAAKAGDGIVQVIESVVEAEIGRPNAVGLGHFVPGPPGHVLCEDPPDPPPFL
mgnify:CR=1 FL=1